MTGTSSSTTEWLTLGLCIEPFSFGTASNLYVLNLFSSYFRFIFVKVTANDEWPVVGVVLGFPPFSTDLYQPPRCAPAIAHRLQLLYDEALHQFDKAYIKTVSIRRPTAEEVTSAKRWVEEQKRLAFNRSSF